MKLHLLMTSSFPSRIWVKETAYLHSRVAYSYGPGGGLAGLNLRVHLSMPSGNLDQSTWRKGSSPMDTISMTDGGAITTIRLSTIAAIRSLILNHFYFQLFCSTQAQIQTLPWNRHAFSYVSK